MYEEWIAFARPIRARLLCEFTERGGETLRQMRKMT